MLCGPCRRFASIAAIASAAVARTDLARHDRRFRPACAAIACPSTFNRGIRATRNAPPGYIAFGATPLQSQQFRKSLGPMHALASATVSVVERTREHPRQRLRLTGGCESGLAPR